MLQRRLAGACEEEKRPWEFGVLRKGWCSFPWDCFAASESETHFFSIVTLCSFSSLITFSLKVRHWQRTKETRRLLQRPLRHLCCDDKE